MNTYCLHAHPNRITSLIAILVCLCVSASIVEAQNSSLDSTKIRVSYTYNFAKNIRWPLESRMSSFNIGLFQVEDQMLAREFRKLNTARLKGVPIKVRKVTDLNSLTNYDLIYVGSQDETVINNIQTLIQDKPILMVTDKISNKRIVMINLIQTNNQQLQFEVNKANIINNRLEALPELILLGGTEIDIAALFREGQATLIELQNELNAQRSQFNQLRNQADIQKALNEQLVKQTDQLSADIKGMNQTNQTLNKKNKILNQQISNMNEELSSLNQELESLKTTIEDSKKTIAVQRAEISSAQDQRDLLVNQVNRRNQELDIKQAELSKRQAELDVISATITNKEEELITLNETIEVQEQQLRIQQTSIQELDKLVHAQQRSLLFLWGLVILGTTLFFVAIYAYRTKRRDNERLAKHSQDLQVARDKLELEKRKAEAANRAKGAFLSLMSHELRTPLQSIIGYTDLMIEEMRLQGDESYVDQLTRVNTNGERLLELINNTLDLAKIEAGKMKVQLSSTNLNSLIDEAVSNIKPLLTKNKNELLVNINNNDLTPIIDYSKLLHILVNLLSNATKFTKNGTISVNIQNNSNLLNITVSDTGIGMTKDQLDEIFTRFHQVNPDKNKKIKGTGLGLSITQHFCEIMGGSIRAESIPGKGADFIINIPLPVVVTEKAFMVIDDDQKEEQAA